ncbi:MAG: phosphotransferase [Candidatus Dormibacteraeota bacterium]|nr:phosphotransferase [Candidatus Dormibacteraeota bacterium]
MEPALVVERLWPGRRASIVALSGGITNRNYRVEVDGFSYVLRVGGNDTDLLGIDRVTEHAASLRAAEIGVGPEVVAFVESEGWLVTRFIEGRGVSPEEIRRPDGIRRVAEVLRRIHNSSAIPGHFDAHAVVEEYRTEAEAHFVPIPGEFAIAHLISKEIRSARGPQPLVPCHNDLLNANFLDDGEIRVVDWEYAGMGDRFFDLANLSVNHDFGVEEDTLLLAAYFGVERPADLAALRLMRVMSDFREAMWGVLQSGISELDFDFTGYAAKHFRRLLVAAGDAQFDHYVDAATLR